MSRIFVNRKFVFLPLTRSSDLVTENNGCTSERARPVHSSQPWAASSSSIVVPSRRKLPKLSVFESRIDAASSNVERRWLSSPTAQNGAALRPGAVDGRVPSSTPDEQRWIQSSSRCRRRRAFRFPTAHEWPTSASNGKSVPTDAVQLWSSTSRIASTEPNAAVIQPIELQSTTESYTRFFLRGIWYKRHATDAAFDGSLHVTAASCSTAATDYSTYLPTASASRNATTIQRRHAAIDAEL